MANKKRRNKKIRRQQVAAGARQTQGHADSASAAAEPAAPVATAAGPASPPPRVAPRSTVSGPRSRSQASQTTTIDIESRVPYFASDLRRIALTAGALVAVIVGASFFIH